MCTTFGHSSTSPHQIPISQPGSSFIAPPPHESFTYQGINVPASLLVSFILWHIWKIRNENLFNNLHNPRHPQPSYSTLSNFTSYLPHHRYLLLLMSNTSNGTPLTLPSLSLIPTVLSILECDELLPEELFVTTMDSG